MALITCEHFSETLGLSLSMRVLLPQGVAGPLPTLYLLHGLSDDDSIWLRRSSIERYADERGLAVVMPTTGRGYYTDAIDGPAWYRYIAEELPALAEGWFPLGRERAQRFIAGHSMGGYGAFRIAFRQPTRWAAAASLSGVTDLAAYLPREDAVMPHTESRRIFGALDVLAGSAHDLHQLARQLASSAGPKPALFQCCGTEDYLLAINRQSRLVFGDLALDHCYEEGPGGHDWCFWDHWIQRVLAWLPLPAIA